MTTPGGPVGFSARVPATTAVGTVDGSVRAVVDDGGAIAPGGASWNLDWWVGADDRWRVPAREVAVRQHRVGGMPVLHTAMRVPGGDAIQRVYALGGDPPALVVEFENDSPAPFVVALVTRYASTLRVHDATIVVDGVFGLSSTRSPSRWARSRDATTLMTVTAGRAAETAFDAVRDRGARLEAAWLYPVAHRTRLRVALSRATTRGAVPGIGDVRALAGVDAAVAGWRAVLGRGMRFEIDDHALVERVDGARADVVLAAGARPDGARLLAALEDWGFDREAEAAWRRAGGRARRGARRRSPVPSWASVRDERDSAAFLVGLRSLLVREVDDGRTAVDLAVDWPEAWRGQAVTVQDAPTRHGMVSFAVRWHGARPALLWDVPDGVLVRAPGLDASWSTDQPRGEALLAAPPGRVR